MLRYIMSNNTVWHKPVIIIHMCCDRLRSLAVSQRNSPVPKYNNSMLIIPISDPIVNNLNFIKIRQLKKSVKIIEKPPLIIYNNQININPKQIEPRNTYATLRT